MGTLWLECPSCSLPKGTPKYAFGPNVGDAQFACNCGGEALSAYRRASDGLFKIICMACGANQTNAIFGDGA